jgi:hypothetical protein
VVDVSNDGWGNDSSEVESINVPCEDTSLLICDLFPDVAKYVLPEAFEGKDIKVGKDSIMIPSPADAIKPPPAPSKNNKYKIGNQTEVVEPPKPKLWVLIAYDVKVGRFNSAIHQKGH